MRPKPRVMLNAALPSRATLVLRRRPRMAGLAHRRSVMEFVAVDAGGHRRDGGRLGHGCHLGDLSMARLALYAGVQMFAVRPVHAHGEFVDAHPRNGLPRLRVGRKFLDRRLVRGNRAVTGHARAGCWERHQIAWLGIGVAGLALQAQRQVGFVAVRERLHGRRVRGHVGGHVGSSRRLLRFYIEWREQQRRGQ